MARKTKRTIVLSIVVLIILVLVLFFGRSYFFPWGKALINEEQPKVLTEEQQFDIRPEPEPPAPEKETPPAAVQEEKPPETPVPLRKPLKVKKSDYERVSDDVHVFFDYLDQQDYVKSYKIKGGSYEHAKRLISRLAANPPVVSGETKDLFSILRNMAHFYRTLKRENVSLIKGVLSREEEITEASMDMLFQWIIMETERKNSEIQVSLANLYEYAGFFLNTLAGKAYLARRDSRTRILLTYYSIVILDMANQKRLNRHGIDILPPLKLAIDDINRYIGLEYKKKYLKKLKTIKAGLRNRT